MKTDSVQPFQNQERRRRLIWSAILRYGALLVIWVTVVFPSDGWRMTSSPIFHVFMALYVLANTLYLAQFWKWRRVEETCHVATILDVLGISALVYVTGMTQSPFVLLYFVQILSSILLVNVLQALLASIFGLVIFTVMAGGTALGLVPPYAAVAAGVQLHDHPIYMPSLLVVLCVFIGFAFTINVVLGKGLRDRAGEVDASMGQLRSARSELISCFHRLEAMGDRLSKERRDREAAQDVLWRMERLTTHGRLFGASLPQLRQYLTAIITQAELVADGRVKEEKIGQTARRIAAAAQSLQELLTAVAPISKSEEDQLFGPVQLNDVVSSCVQQIQAETLARRTVVETVLDSNLPPIHGVKLQLEQILLGLLSNAIDALPEEAGHVKIETSLGEDGTVSMHVSDNGCGISEENIGRIFDPFFTLDPSGGKPGLGLHLMRILAQRHGGDISVKSSPGRGSTFTLRLSTA